MEVTQIKGIGEIRQSVQRVRSDVIGAQQGLSIQRGPTATRPHRLAISTKDHCHIRCSHPRTSPPSYETGDKGNLAGTVAKEQWILNYEYARSNTISGPVDPPTRRQLNQQGGGLDRCIVISWRKTSPYFQFETSTYGGVFFQA